MRKQINRVIASYLRYRMKRIEYVMEHPYEVQDQLLTRLISINTHTKWGKMHNYKQIRSYEDFKKNVPIQDYETLKPFIKRMMYGERDVLWVGKTKWFSKSSGTTGDKSKFIPVTRDHMKDCHIKSSWDVMSLLYHNKPDARQFECKSMLLGGSLTTFDGYSKSQFGDVSAIMMNNMPWIGRPFFTPSFEVALMTDFEEKINRMVDELSVEKDLVMIAGVPTWTIVLMNKIMEKTGAQNMFEIWPNLEVYTHGGVSFTPYKEQFKTYFPGDQLKYMEIYNASEGYFGIQNDFDEDDMLLLLDNGIFYEFIAMCDWGTDRAKAITLDKVKTGVNYAMVVTTNAGLWRYVPGDTICFTSTSPYKIQVTGRTKQFVNAFGEEVMVSNTDKALAETCKVLGAEVLDYTVAPKYMNGTEKGGHEWLIEFAKEPLCIDHFNTLLDDNLQKVNSDYEAKRFQSMALECLILKQLPKGTFNNWLKSKGKYGSQSKVPRLANHRKYVEEILEFVDQ